MKIIPHLWFDTQAQEAAAWYVSLFPQSQIDHVIHIENTPSGDCDVVSFTLAGQPFSAISAGPLFTFNPAISFMVHCESAAEVDQRWAEMSPSGSILMPLDVYPFSPRYGWLQDRFGVSWQLMYMENGQSTQKITPNLLFSGVACGKAEEAVSHYVSTFGEAQSLFTSRYAPGEAKTPQAQINYASFVLEGMVFSAMDNGYPVDFTFNEAISFMVLCDDQAEIDHYWECLSAVPEAEACGWLKDRFGLSWQIVPRQMGEWQKHANREEMQRLTGAFLQMKKFDLAALEKARTGQDMGGI